MRRLLPDAGLKSEPTYHEYVKVLGSLLGSFSDELRSDSAVLGPDADAARFAEPFSRYSPTAWIYVPGQASRLAKMSLSFFTI
jgi:hypothetical protein